MRRQAPYLFVLAGALAIIAFYLAPNDAARTVIQQTIGVASVLAIIVGIRWYQPTAHRGWLLVAAAYGLLVIGDLVYDVLVLTVGEPDGTSVADIAYLAAYPVLAAGVAVMARTQHRGRDRDGLIDGSILALAATFLAWQAIAAPALSDGSARVIDQIAANAFLLGDIVVLVVAARLSFRVGERVPAYWLFLGSIVVMLFGDVVFDIQGDAYHYPSWVDATWMFAYLLVAAAALHPSMASLTSPTDQTEARLTRTRVALLATALLAVPLIGIVDATDGDHTVTPLSLIVTFTIIVTLVLWRLVGLARDVEHAHESMTARDERFRALVQNTSDVIAVVTPAGMVTYISPAVERVLGYSPSQVEGRQSAAFMHPDDVPGIQEAMAGLLPRSGGTIWVEFRHRHADGSWRWTEASMTNLIDHRSVGGIVINERDITDRRRADDEIRHQALHDGLTALPNRVLFLDRLELALARSKRQQSTTAVLFLDLDHFKVVNDSLGHDAGDSLLCLVAERISATLRPGDTVARIGGDEFTVLCEDLDSAQQARAVANRIGAAMADPFPVAGTQVHMSVSTGIALARASNDRPDRLLRDADAAMYRAKDLGRARAELFDATMRDRAVMRLRTENELRQALADGDLRLHYQPIFDLRDGHLVGLEALARWDHPHRGMLLPDQFIPIAEETGLIDQLGHWALAEACRQVARWTSAGRAPPISVAINLSTRQLGSGDLAADLRAILYETGVPADRLCLEITESVLLSHLGGTLDALRSLKDLGVQIAIDDFGTGYSSLNYVKRLPVDILKVDRSFVSGLADNPEDAAIAETVITLAHSLGLTAIAEGVETTVQLDEITALGCDLAQGFLMARPAAAVDLDLTDTLFPDPDPERDPDPAQLAKSMRSPSR